MLNRNHACDDDDVVVAGGFIAGLFIGLILYIRPRFKHEIDEDLTNDDAVVVKSEQQSQTFCQAAMSMISAPLLVIVLGLGLYAVFAEADLAKLCPGM